MTFVWNGTEAMSRFTSFSTFTTLFFTVLAATPLPAWAGEFTVTDSKAESEISELTRVYVDGKLAASFKLDDGHQEKTVKITTPLGRVDHSYTLCGEITIRTPEGRVETHEVSSDGTLHNPDHHHFYGIGSENFTEFFLLDPDDPTAAEHHTAHSGVCALPVS